VEVLTAEQSIYLFEIAEATQLFSNVSKWWIGLSDFTHEGTWTWSQSSTQADLSLYSEFFSPNSASHNTDDCVAMTITDRQLAWEDINCITNLEGDIIVPVCQCKGEDCSGISETTTANTTPIKLECKGNWLDAGDLGCIQFMTDDGEITFVEAKDLCQANKGFLVETKTKENIELVSTLANVIHSFKPDINSWWIGTFQTSEDLWIWIQGSEFVEETNWATGQPNGTVSDQRCAVLTLNGKGEYKWDDVECSLSTYDGKGIAPICQECRPEDLCEEGTTVISDTTTAETTLPTTTVSWPANCKNNPDSSACYLYVASKASWTDAETSCNTLGGHLASSLSQEENSFLGDSVLRYTNVWIGGTSTGGSWAWSDQQPWDYENWKTGEPTGDCAYFSWETSKWSAYDCPFQLSYVCKFI